MHKRREYDLGGLLFLFVNESALFAYEIACSFRIATEQDMIVCKARTIQNIYKTKQALSNDRNNASK